MPESTYSPSAKPFLFSQSFDAGVLAAEEKKKASPTFSEEELALAREQAYGQGFVAGKEAALRELAQEQTNLLSHIQSVFVRLADGVWNHYAAQKQGAVTIALAIARKMLPDTLRRNGQQEILAEIEGAVHAMIEEPRLVLRVHEEHFDFISREVSAMTQRLGYAGKMIILADDQLKAEDCRLEWADGGMTCSLSALWSDMERQLARHHATDEEKPVMPQQNHPTNPEPAVASMPTRMAI